MDPIALYLQNASTTAYSNKPSKRLVLSAFMHVHSRLSMLQLNKGQISYDDLIQSLQFAISSGMIHDLMITQELPVYAGILYEACFQPAMLMKGPGFVLYKDLIGNETMFLQAVVEVLLAHTPLGKENPVVEEFRLDAAMTLKKLRGSFPGHEVHTNHSPAMIHSKHNPNLNGGSPHQQQNFFPASMEMNYGRKAPPTTVHGSGNSQYGSLTHQSMPPTVPAYQQVHHSSAPASQSLRASDFMSHNSNPSDRFVVPSEKSIHSLMNKYDYSAPPTPQVLTHNSVNPTIPNVTNAYRITEIEKSEPIVRLLAHLRKSGMDILFPQIIHDKILMCIYVAITCTSSLTHRELIDMVMAIKDSEIISQISVISKTKIRGALALLKHGQLFLTKGEDGEAVQLYLAEGIHSFQDLRERHDHYLNQWILQHHLYIPAVLKGELLWQIDATTKQLRLQELKTLEETIEHYYMNIYQPPSTGKGASSTSTLQLPSTFTNSPSDPPTSVTNTAININNNGNINYFSGLGIPPKQSPESRETPPQSWYGSFQSLMGKDVRQHHNNTTESLLPPELASNRDNIPNKDSERWTSHLSSVNSGWNLDKSNLPTHLKDNTMPFSLFPSVRTNDTISQGSDGGSRQSVPSETRPHHEKDSMGNYWTEMNQGRDNSNSSFCNAMTDIDSMADPSHIAKTSSLSLSTSLPLAAASSVGDRESPRSETSFSPTQKLLVGDTAVLADLETMKLC